MKAIATEVLRTTLWIQIRTSKPSCLTGWPNVIKNRRPFLSWSSGGLTSLTSRVRPGSAIIRKTQAGPEWRGTMYLTPSRRKCRPTWQLSSPSYSP